jgi:hypothetical protein
MNTAMIRPVGLSAVMDGIASTTGDRGTSPTYVLRIVPTR